MVGLLGFGDSGPLHLPNAQVLVQRGVRTHGGSAANGLYLRNTGGLLQEGAGDERYGEVLPANLGAGRGTLAGRSVIPDRGAASPVQVLRSVLQAATCFSQDVMEGPSAAGGGHGRKVLRGTQAWLLFTAAS